MTKNAIGKYVRDSKGNYVPEFIEKIVSPRKTSCHFKPSHNLTILALVVCMFASGVLTFINMMEIRTIEAMHRHEMEQLAAKYDLLKEHTAKADEMIVREFGEILDKKLEAITSNQYQTYALSKQSLELSELNNEHAITLIRKLAQ